MIATPALAGLLAFLVASEAPPPVAAPEAHLPETTLILIDLQLGPETIAKARGTSLWEIWEHPETQRFLEKPILQMRKDFEAWIALTGEEIGFDLREVLLLEVPPRVAVAIPGIDFEAGEPTALVLVADLGAEAEKAGRAIERAVEVARKKADGADWKLSSSEREASGVKIRRLVRTYKRPKEVTLDLDELIESLQRNGDGGLRATAEPEMVEAHSVFEWAFLGTVLVGAAGDKPDSDHLELERYLSPEKPLAAHADFQTVRARLGAGTPFAFVRVDRIVEDARKAAAAGRTEEGESRTGTNGAKGPDVDALLRSLGVSSIRSVGWAQSIEGRELVDHYFVLAPEPREGLIYDLLSGPLPRDRLVRFAPRTAQVYGEASVDFGRLWGHVGKLVDLLAEKDGRESFAKGVAAVEEKIGAGIAEVIACFKPHVAAYSSVPATMISPGEQGLILPLADAARLRDILAKVRALPEVAEYLLFDEESHQGVETVRITLKNLPIPLMPTYAFLKDTLVITESPFALQKLITSLEDGSGSLADSEKFRSVEVAAFPEGARFGEYVDMEVLVERTYQLIVSALNMAMGPTEQGELKRLGFDLNLLPSGKAVSKGLGLGIEHVRMDAAGVEYRGRSAFGAGVAGVYKAIVGAMLPFAAANEMRETVHEHYRKGSRKNMERIHHACASYLRTVGGGRHPRDLVSLLGAGLIEESVLVAPGDTERKTVEDPESGEMVVVSYRYRPKGYEEEGRRLVLWEADAWLDGATRLCLFNDGTIDEVEDEEDLDALIKGQERR